MGGLTNNLLNGVKEETKMSILKRISDTTYVYINRDSNMIFTLEKGDIGVWSAGSCWRLRLGYAGVETFLACFVTSDDGRNCYKSCYGGKIWNVESIFDEAEQIIKNMNGA